MESIYPQPTRSPSPTLYSQTVLPSTQNVPDAARQQAGPDTDASAPPSSNQEAEGALADEQIEPSTARNDLDPSPQPPMEPETEPTPVTPKVSLVLLLVSGRRRTLEFDPKTTVGELKEVVWSTWPSEWSDELPPSSAFLRILYLGRILTDDTILSSLNLPEPPESTVVHVSVRSFAPTSSDEDLKKKPKRRGTRRGRGSGDANPGVDGVDDGADEEENGTGCCGGCIIC